MGWVGGRGVVVGAEGEGGGEEVVGTCVRMWELACVGRSAVARVLHCE